MYNGYSTVFIMPYYDVPECVITQPVYGGRHMEKTPLLPQNSPSMCVHPSSFGTTKKSEPHEAIKENKKDKQNEECAEWKARTCLPIFAIPDQQGLFFFVLDQGSKPRCRTQRRHNLEV